MQENVVYQNKGIFSEEKLADVASFADWSLDNLAAEAKKALRLLYERTQQLLEGDPSEPETQFYFLGPLFHQLEYLITVSEPIPFSETTEESALIDYVLFSDVERFAEVVSERGKSSFFQGALAIVDTAAFGQDLINEEGEESEEDIGDNLADKLNRCLTINGIDWGIVTNGRLWRLFHRTHAAEQDVYFQVDLIEALRSPEPDAWKWFWCFFRKEAFLPAEDGGPSLLGKLLG